MRWPRKAVQSLEACISIVSQVQFSFLMCGLLCSRETSKVPLTLMRMAELLQEAGLPPGATSIGEYGEYKMWTYVNRVFCCRQVSFPLGQQCCVFEIHMLCMVIILICGFPSGQKVSKAIEMKKTHFGAWDSPTCRSVKISAGLKSTKVYSRWCTARKTWPRLLLDMCTDESTSQTWRWRGSLQNPEWLPESIRDSMWIYVDDICGVLEEAASSVTFKSQ